MMSILDDFRAHHCKPANLVFHVVCGFVYTTLVLQIIGPLSTMAYTLALCTAYPAYTPSFVVMGVIINSMHSVFSAFPVHLKLKIAIAAYLAPELSHWMTGERTVLQADQLTVPSVLTNMAVLLPFSIIAFTDALTGSQTTCSAARASPQSPQTTSSRSK